MKLVFAVLIASLALSVAISSRSNAEVMRSYQQRLAKIVNTGNSTWVAGHNSRFDTYTPETIKNLMGTKLNTPAHLRLPIKQVPKIAAIPTEFDARSAWKNCTQISTIRDQSDCGSCWAFGAVEAASDRICIETNGAMQPMLSAEDLLSCCDSCGDGCSGGYPSAAWSWFTQTGVVTGGNYNNFDWCQSYSLPNCDHHENGSYPMCGPNEYPTPACSSSCDAQSKYPTPYSKDKHMFASSYGIDSNIDDIATEIMTNGPVEAAFTVYEDFITYRSGIYSHKTGGVLGGHAVKILGWGVDNGVKYWLVANSWNADWGSNGYFKILRGSDECGIEDEITAGTFFKKESTRPAVIPRRTQA